MCLLELYPCEHDSLSGASIPSNAKLEEQRKSEPKYEELTNKEIVSRMCRLSQAETSESSSCVYTAVMNNASQVSFAIKVN